MCNKATAILLGIFSISCAIDYPKDIWLDSNFSQDEERIIILAMNRWEEQTEIDLFRYRGRLQTDIFQKENLSDNLFIVYKIEDPEDGDAHLVWTNTEGYLGVAKRSGWSTSADMLIFSRTLHERKDEEAYLRRLFSLCLHEFGHVLMIGHIDDPSAMMYPGYYDDKCLTSIDLEAFCAMNECAQNFSPQESADECMSVHGNDDVLEDL